MLTIWRSVDRYEVSCDVESREGKGSPTHEKVKFTSKAAKKEEWDVETMCNRKRVKE